MRTVQIPIRREWPMLELDTLDTALLRRYWLGTATIDERAEVDAWFVARPGRREWYEQFRHALAARGTITELPLGEIARRTAAIELAAKGRTQASVAAPDSNDVIKRLDAGRPIRDSVKSLPGRRRWFSIPTLALGASALAFGTVIAVASSWHTLLARHTRPVNTASSVYVTGNGQRATVSLPDGSQVILNVGSRLDVPSDYIDGNRTLRLTGEALFSVQNQERAPFLVTAGQATARVLGTTFTTRYYPGDSVTAVAVRSGKVEVVSPDIHPIVVASTQAVEVGVGRAQLEPSEASAYSFASGVMTLKHVPLPSAIVELNRWYDADIRLGDPSLASLGLNAECNEGSLEDLVDLLEGALGVRIVRVGKQITLYPASS